MHNSQGPAAAAVAVRLSIYVPVCINNARNCFPIMICVSVLHTKRARGKRNTGHAQQALKKWLLDATC